MKFDEAVSKLPLCLNGVDPHYQKSVADLRFLVQHRIDLHEEGEAKLHHTQVKACKRFLELTRS